MTLRKLCPIGHPILLARAKEVTAIDDPALQALIDDMIATLADARGLGLAAPQVYASARVILVHRERGAGEAPPEVLINPEITPLDDAREPGLEGCLSIPRLHGLVPRFRHIAYRGLDRAGRPVAGEAEGLHARVLQHEVDHLDGILFPSRMDDPGLLSVPEESHHLVELAAARSQETKP